MGVTQLQVDGLGWKKGVGNISQPGRQPNSPVSTVQMNVAPVGVPSFLAANNIARRHDLGTDGEMRLTEEQLTVENLLLDLEAVALSCRRV